MKANKDISFIYTIALVIRRVKRMIGGKDPLGNVNGLAYHWICLY
jgi:hypothetical protein